jgi:aminopeptidase
VKEVPVIVNERTTSWTIGPSPNPRWAQRVHPELDADQALATLWDEIVHVCRLDSDDPVSAWRERMRAIVASADRMSERRFDAIHLSGPGTDLTVGLLPSHRWLGADFTTIDGRTHYPNIPTEEIFTTPDPDRVDGQVTSTMPLEVYGSFMSGIRIAFEGGRATKVDADEGAEALRSIVAKEGADRLGEIALVDGEGRIGPLGTVFFETLLDENAASHIALGNAYTFPLEDDTDRARANKSGIHVDFMIGSNEVDVDGITREGDRVAVLRGGSWQI